MPLINLQDRSEDYPDLEETLEYSRYEWLDRKQVTDICGADLPVSDETIVQHHQLGLYKFRKETMADELNWDFLHRKNTREDPPLRYDFSRLELETGQDGRTTYLERRLYKPLSRQLYGDYYYAHYLTYGLEPGAEHPNSGDDAGDFSVEEEEEQTTEEEGDSDNSDDSGLITIELKIKIKISIN